MPTIRRPANSVLIDLMEQHASSPCSYAPIGLTRRPPPVRGYTLDHNCRLLGHGESCFSRAVAAIGRWEMFQLGWVDTFPQQPTIAVGERVAVVAHVLGLWWVNISRIVTTIDESDDSGRRVGFAYGTLDLHAERGEERFLIDWRSADDTVWYDLLAYSRPRSPLAWLGYPLARATQRRFARDSLAAMERAARS